STQLHAIVSSSVTVDWRTIGAQLRLRSSTAASTTRTLPILNFSLMSIGMSHIDKPITKAMAAELLSVSLRTIDYWIADGTLLMPTSIGRKVYWHPEHFSQWLDRKLGRNHEQKINKEHKDCKPGRPRNQLH